MVLYIIYIYELVWYSKLGECIIYLKYISYRNQDVSEINLTAGAASQFICSGDIRVGTNLSLQHAKTPRI